MTSGVLCYSGARRAPFGGYDGTGVHLSRDGRLTLCGLGVLDVPTVPRVIAPLSCPACLTVAQDAGQFAGPTTSAGTES